MHDMREIIDERTFEAFLRALAVMGPLLGLAAGALGGARRKRLLRGLAAGSLGPLIWSLWRLYSYLVRYDPQSQYFGLEKVSVLVLNVLIFTAVGGILGLLWAAWAPREPEPPPSQEGSEGQTE
jgi:hypothetical protein